MKKSLVVVSSIVLSLFTCVAYAGNEGPHGGNAIVCENQNGTIDLLDHYEGAITMGSELDMGDPSSDYMAQVNYVLDRLSTLDPVAAERFRGYARTFEEEMALVSQTQLKAIDDSNEHLNPMPGCAKVQFAVQLIGVKAYQKRYYINQDLWLKADSRAKAGLVLHELIYRDAATFYGHKNSDGARYYNYIISSKLMNSIGDRGYERLLRDAGLFGTVCLFTLDRQGIRTCPNEASSSSYFDELAISGQKLTLLDGTVIPVHYVSGKNGFIGRVSCPDGAVANLKIQDRFVSVPCEMYNYIELYSSESGVKSIKRLFLSIARHAELITVNTRYGTLSSPDITLTEDGNVESILQAVGKEISIQGKPVKLMSSARRDCRMSFHLNGTVKEAWIQGGVSLKNANGKMVYMPNGFFEKSEYLVTFDENERVITASER